MKSKEPHIIKKNQRRIREVFSGIVFFVLLFLHPLQTSCQEKVKNVVIFFSYGPNLPAFEKILAGLNNTIRGTTHEPVNIMTEYLDLSRTMNDDYSKFIIQLYDEKLKTLKVDLLITAGPGVNDALLKYGNPALNSLPMINIDLDIPGRTTLHDLGIENGKEIILKFRPELTLRHAMDLFPDHQEIFVISGVSALDSYYTSLVRKAKNEFEAAHNFQFISNLTMDSTIRFVKTIPQNSIVFVPSYFQDATKVSFSTPEVMEIISKNSQAPVFLSLTDAGFNSRGGGIGGYLFSYINLGKEVGRVAHEVLNGKQMKEITVLDNVFYEHMYDWNELKRWRLTRSKLIPADSLFYNKDISFIELYKWYILAILIFILSQTFLIIYLIRLNKRQKAISAKMQVTERMHRELAHTDRLSKMSILTAALSHELFQPLAAIRFTAQAGKQFIQTDKLDATRASQMFENILEDETRATKLIRSVKSLMKADTTEKEKINLNTLLEETIDIIRADAERDGVTIYVALDVDPVYVLGDKIQLQQVVMNFIRNAINAMHKNDPGNKALEIALRLMKDEVIVSVRDSGPGLDPSVKENLFKPFISTKKEGFGIGLTLCKSLIEKHNGKIWGENTPEGGAMFAFSLPVVKH